MYTGSSNYHRSLSGMHKKTGGSKQRQKISKNKKKLSLCYRTPFGSNRYGRIFLEDLILLNQDRIVKAPPVSQYTVQSTSADEEKSEETATENQDLKNQDLKNHGWKNQGSATLEVTLILPILLFALWMFYSMGQIFIMENQIYQAVNNTADSMAETAYLKQVVEEGIEVEGSRVLDWGEAFLQFRTFLGENERVERYVFGGRNGILLDGTPVLDEEGFICIGVKYLVRIQAPFFRSIHVPVQAHIRQKAYVGYVKSEDPTDQTYVYVAEHSTVYHLSRSCSHLKLTIYTVSSAVLDENYPGLRACEYCGERPADIYYVTPTGDCYHTSRECSGLKRTVRRVLKSEVPGYAPCSRCGS